MDILNGKRQTTYSATFQNTVQTQKHLNYKRTIKMNMISKIINTMESIIGHMWI